MNDQNSTPDNIVRPSDLMAELDIKKSTYYGDLEYLDIKAGKDESGKTYLTFSQANQIRALRSHVSKTGKRDGFVYGGLVVSNNNDLAINSEANNTEENNIYVQKEEPTANLESNIVREAEELAARGMAMNNLLKIQLASQMSFDDLSPDLQEKVNIAREVANPKWTPAELAQKILAQHRSSRRVQS
ncbi:MAG: hypothetical protein QNJ53_06035 [Pleurocapsa sp. MO_192.B19]|nr:hypothetical protein [Pleurocapsa sp. MO_192.B19]